MKQCNKCKLFKQSDQFSYRNSSSGTRRKDCKSCVKILTQKHYKDNKEEYAKRDKKNRWFIRTELHKKMNDYLKDKKCVDCGEEDSVTFDFDHLDGKKKVANVGNMIANMFPWEKIMNEIEKCEIVCANCHRKRTAKRSGNYKMKN